MSIAFSVFCAMKSPIMQRPQAVRQFVINGRFCIARWYVSHAWVNPDLHLISMTPVDRKFDQNSR